MSITGMKLRTAVPCGDWRSMKVEAPVGGATEGAMDKIQDTVGVYMQTEDAEVDVAFLYHAEKILLPKKDGSGEAIAQGKKVYYDAAVKKLTGVAGANLWVAICLEAALLTDTTVLVDFKGDKAT